MEKQYEYDGKIFTFKELKKYFKNYAAKNKNRKKSTRWPETLKIIEGDRVLDFGCWKGSQTYTIGELGSNEVIGIDTRQSDIDIANDFFKLPNITYEVRDIFTNPFPDSYFDCIVFTEVIEHVENPIDYLREFFRILKPGGFLILSTPNATSLKNFLYAISYRKKEKREKILSDISNEDKHTGTHLEHIFNWDFPTLARLIITAGFRINHHSFMRSGPIRISLFGKKIELIQGESKILKFVPTLMVHHLIKAQKPIK
jgi:2-polyprenyl-3-methyl-5-hydroxy-6-metoxy-1,4-benzoquinol methylase